MAIRKGVDGFYKPQVRDTLSIKVPAKSIIPTSEKFNTFLPSLPITVSVCMLRSESVFGIVAINT